MLRLEIRPLADLKNVKQNKFKHIYLMNNSTHICQCLDWLVIMVTILFPVVY